MEDRTRVLLAVLVALAFYGCMFYYITDGENKPQYTTSFINSNGSVVYLDSNGKLVHLKLNGTLGRANISSMTYNSSLRQSNISQSNHNTPLMKKILLWTSWFDDKNWNHMMQNKQTVYITGSCNVNCSLSANQKNPLDYDLLVFHGRDSQKPPKMRLRHQIYMMLLQESPWHRGNTFIRGEHFYNWSATYSLKSDFVMPYLKYQKVQPGKPTTLTPVNITANMLYKRQKGEAVVSWIVSNCHTAGKREEYVKELNKHITVDIYGNCGKKCLKGKDVLHGASCHQHLAKTGRKFYLAFENSACRDYITEKAMHPLDAGMVPVVYGGLGVEDYLTALPPGSFINTRNFTSPKHLADYLNYLDGNDTAYLAYHAWRGQYEFDMGPNVWCNICQALHNTSMIPEKNINWDTFWSPNTECDNNLLTKIGGTRTKGTKIGGTKAKGTKIGGTKAKG